jgi:hypothetical protein
MNNEELNECPEIEIDFDLEVFNDEIDGDRRIKVKIV